MSSASRSVALETLVERIKNCKVCVDCPQGEPLPHEPRPVLQVNIQARIGVFGQAPGLRVHKSGVPFTDPSGDRLRLWMGVDREIFYDERKIAILPMGFCFPGYDAKGADLPPRRECAQTWRQDVLSHLTNLRLILLVGGYAVRWHIKDRGKDPLKKIVSRWRSIVAESQSEAEQIRMFPLPHPSWRNNHWIKANPWFEKDLLPDLRAYVKKCLAGAD